MVLAATLAFLGLCAAFWRIVTRAVALARGGKNADAERLLERGWWLVVAIPLSAFGQCLAVGIQWRATLEGTVIWSAWRHGAFYAVVGIGCVAWLCFSYASLTVDETRRPGAAPSRKEVLRTTLLRNAGLFGLPLTFVLVISMAIDAFGVASPLFVVTAAAAAFLGQIVWPRVAVRLLPVRALADPALRSDLLQLSERVGLCLQDVFVVGDSGEGESEEEREHNALVFGIGPAKRVFLTSDLVADLPRDQVRAIFAHECAHIRRHHIARQIGHVSILWAALSALSGLGESLPIAIQVLAALALVAGAPFVLRALQRRHEVEADDLAARWVGAETLADALQALEPGEEEESWWQRARSTHPGRKERIERLRRAGMALYGPGRATIRP